MRLAAARAVTRSAYARVIDLGVNAVSEGLFVKGTPYYSKTTLPTYDPTAAKSLLQRCERKTGQPVTMELGYINSAAVERPPHTSSRSSKRSASG